MQQLLYLISRVRLNFPPNIMVEVLLLLSIASIPRLAFFITRKKYGENFFKKYVESLGDIKQIFVKVLFAVIYLAAIGPALEELIFRLPLLIFFDKLDKITWIFIILNSLVFGAAHWNSLLSKAIQAGQKDVFDLDVAPEEKVELVKKEKISLVHNIIKVLLTTGMGIFIGYRTIKSQSIITAFLLHAAWNLVLGFLLPNIMQVIAMLAVFVVLHLQELICER